MSLSSIDKYNWIKLALSENIGPITFKDLLKYFKTPENALNQIPNFAKKGGRKRPIQIASNEQVDFQLNQAKKLGIDIIASYETSYPLLLKQIDDCPPLLFVRGNASLLNEQGIAIVGSRNSSINGQNLTRRMAHDLASHKYCVVSGMAKGIDTAAHQGALASDTHQTIAVLGTSVEDIYPKENTNLYHEIKEKGCLISENAIGAKLFTGSFPRRNRIISGMTLGTTIIEAGLKSGSLITARQALAQNREVFAIPGSPMDARSEGPNHLIQEGAHLVQNATDILNILSFNTTKTLFDYVQENNDIPCTYPTLDEQDLSKAREIIFNRLSPEVTSVHELIKDTNLPAQLVTIVLVELELAGHIERFAGNKIALIYSNEWK